MKPILKVLSLAAAAVFTLAAQAADYPEPEDAVAAYIHGVSTGSGAHIRAAFADNAEIQYYDAEGAYKFYSREAFADLVDTGNQWDASIEITQMLRTVNAANATVEFTWGESSEHGYVDYLNLVFAGGRWHITNKVAQYVKR